MISFEEVQADDLAPAVGRTRSFSGFIAQILDLLAKEPSRFLNGAKNPVTISKENWDAEHARPASDGGPNSAKRIGPAISLVHDNLRRKEYFFRVDRQPRKSDGKLLYVIKVREGADLADDKARYQARVAKRQEA